MNLESTIRHAGSSMRWDIQAIRGWAIALVIIDHAKLPIVTGGFLGVDIFFVVSGFLMTGLIIRALDAGTFSLGDFYSRRARRLLPAAYSTIVLTALAAPFLLDPYELGDFVKQVVGSLTFTVNYVLWQQIDYFNQQAAMKPLLHMWSLSLEEQYYLFIPLLLMFCGRRWRFLVGAALTVGSLGLCIYMVQNSPSAAFYFLPTRAWELGIGSLTAIVIARGTVPIATQVRRGLSLVSVLTLAMVPIIADTAEHPGLAAIAVCLATAWLMAVPFQLSNRRLWALPVWIGDRSYSLYLLHWPLFAYANNIFVREPNLATRLSIIVLCLVLSDLQYRWVEERYRRQPMSKRYLASLAVLPIFIVGCIYGAWSAIATKDDDFRAANTGLSPACVFGDAFSPRPECQTSPSPSTMVWGDSFGMHVVPAVVAATSKGVIQATQPICGPFLDMAAINGRQYKEPWAVRCIKFNDSVFAYLAEHPTIETVVISSALIQYLGEAGQNWQLLVKDRNGAFAVSSSGPAAFRAGVLDTVKRLRALGKKVVFIAPPALSNFDIGRCLERTISGYPTIPAVESCDFPRAEFERLRRDVVAFVDDIEKQASLSILRFSDTTCDQATCHTMMDGVPLYRDEAHLSIEGSRLLGMKTRLKDILEQ